MSAKPCRICGEPESEHHEKMLSGGRIGEITSMLCLCAAMAVRRGHPPEIESIHDPVTGERLPPEVERDMMTAHAEAVLLFRSATAIDLDHAIALYTAHLKAAGYSIEEAGHDN